MGSGKKVLLVEINSLNPPEKYMQYAFKLAEDLNMYVHFLHVFNPEFYPVSMSYNAGGEAVYPAENISYLTEVLTKNYKLAEEEIRSKFSNSDFHISLEIGNTYDVIKKYSSKKNVNMIMIEGNPASLGLTYFTDEEKEILENSSLPVWVIPAGFDYKPIKKIVYAAAYKEADILTLDKAIEVAKIHSSTIKVVHFTDNVSFKENINLIGFEKVVLEKTGYEDIEFEVVQIFKNDFSLSVNNYLSSVKADLLILLKERTSMLKKIFTEGSVIKTIRRAYLPALVFHETQNF